MDFCSQTDIPALPVSVRRTAPSWQPVSREEPIGKRSDGSPPSWGTRPPNRWEGVEPQCAGGDAQSVKVDSVFPLGEPSLPAPHQPVPLPKVHFLFLKWLANQHAGSSCQLKAGRGQTGVQRLCSRCSAEGSDSFRMYHTFYQLQLSSSPVVSEQRLQTALVMDPVGVQEVLYPDLSSSSVRVLELKCKSSWSFSRVL